ncbi:hypothetical protein KI387_014559, partial [Taxus chinensis]
ERSLEPGNLTMYQSGGLLKHRSTNALDDRRCTPIYKLLCYPSNTKGLAKSVYEESINKPGKFDLRLKFVITEAYFVGGADRNVYHNKYMGFTN